MGKIYFQISTVLGLLAVMIGAFGAHLLNHQLSQEMKIVFETGNKYHFYHSLALLTTSILCILNENSYLKFHENRLRLAGIFFCIGLVIFPFSLYALAITQIKILGAVTPIGGASFIIGWVYLIISLK